MNSCKKFSGRKLFGHIWGNSVKISFASAKNNCLLLVPTVCCTLRYYVGTGNRVKLVQHVAKIVICVSELRNSPS